MKKLIALLIFSLIITGCQTTGSHYTRPPTPVTAEFIRAIGIGRPPVNSTSPEQADLLAREMAKTQAYKELSRKIQTVPVVGKRTVEQCIQRKPAVRVKVERVLQSAKVFTEDKLKDGSWRIELALYYEDLMNACK